MTQTIDKLLIRSGFDKDELARDRSRHILYVGIATMALLVVVFSILAITA